MDRDSEHAGPPLHIASGFVFGELVHRWIRRMGRDGFSLWERLLIDVLNPAYRWQAGFDRPVR